MDLKIYYFILLPADDNFTPASIFQGFSPTLIERSRILELLQDLPGDIYEPAFENHNIVLTRRIAGESTISWFPIMLNSLKEISCDISRPFQVIFAGPQENIGSLKKWCDSQSCPPLLIAQEGGHMNPSALNRLTLRDYLGNPESILIDDPEHYRQRFD